MAVYGHHRDKEADVFIQRFILVVAAAVQTLMATCSPRPLAPLLHANGPGTIPDQYIVLFKPGTDPKVVDDLEARVEAMEARRSPLRPKLNFQQIEVKDRGPILFHYGSDNLGFAVRCSKRTLNRIRADQNVLWVEADQKITATFVTETALSKGIDRIDQRLLPLNNTFQYSETGLGVHVYVFDTGILAKHEEFGSRVSDGFSAFHDDVTEDCHGHGTHVAATVGGKNFGVAKNVVLHAVRVVDCGNHGEMSGLLGGVDWLNTKRIKPAVANLSIIAGAQSDSLDLKIRNSIALFDVTYVVSAGNQAANACNYSPAALPEAITVAATTITKTHPGDDTRFILSNYGTCVDLFAPGAGILSAGIASPTDTKIRSGTSMAAAHVSGVAALYLERHPEATPAEVWNAIHANDNVFTITPDWNGVLSAGVGSPNEMLHWGPNP